MDITVWEGITSNFKIEVIHFMVNTSNKFVVYNSNIEIQKVVTLITTSTAFQYQSIIVNIFWEDVKILKKLLSTYHPNIGNYVTIFLTNCNPSLLI